METAARLDAEHWQAMQAQDQRALGAEANFATNGGGASNRKLKRPAIKLSAPLQTEVTDAAAAALAKQVAEATVAVVAAAAKAKAACY